MPQASAFATMIASGMLEMSAPDSFSVAKSRSNTRIGSSLDGRMC